MNKETVEANTIFLTKTGSHSYGTETPESDIDIRGVAIIPDPSLYMGFLNRFNQFEYSVEDTVVYGLQKAIELISNNNPNMLELLFIDEQFFLKNSKFWQKFIDNRDRVLSKKVRFTYSGYAYSQFKRIKKHRAYLLNPPKSKPKREDFGLPAQTRLLTADQEGAFDWLVTRILEDSLEYTKLSPETKAELKTVSFIGPVQSGLPEDTLQLVKQLTGASDEWIEITSREKKYKNALSDWNSYQEWRLRRNKKRQALEDKAGYDCKHASQLVRLFRQGIEILQTGKLEVYRQDREELKQIKNGQWKYEQLEEFINQKEKEIDDLYLTSTLQREPQRVFMDQLCTETIQEYLNDRKP